MNHKALAVARQVFERYAQGGTHRFVESSIFDYEANDKYDIVHCRGVLSHTADKRGAFTKISRFVKPGGYLIFGDPNKAGGFQNMLQRFVVYRHAKDWDGMVAVCEKLFKEDIDRSQSFVNRTRRSIIFDRWVIQSQDDPSVDEVLGWLSANDLVLYSSYPPFLLPLLGDSVHHQPKFDPTAVKGMASVAETIWLLQKDGDRENVQAIETNCAEYSERLAALTEYVANFNSESALDTDRFNKLVDEAAAAFADVSIVRPLQRRFAEFIGEAKTFVRLAESATLDEVRSFITSCKHLFKGACGVRHVDFIAYKRD
jgi:SAM-dependent methyltransferase